MVKKTKGLRHRLHHTGNGTTVGPNGRPRTLILVPYPHAYHYKLYLVALVFLGTGVY